VAAAPRLQVAARIGVGFDTVDIPALTARGIPLMVVGIANARSVAEHAVYFIFALAKRSHDMDRRVRQGVGHDRRSGLPGEVFGKTVLIVGFGRIGSRTAPLCKALGLDVTVYDPFMPAETIREAGYEPVIDIDAALARADFVSIHCPKNGDTVGMFNAARLARMKPGAFLVNTARGALWTRPHWPTPCVAVTWAAPGWTCSTLSRQTHRIRCSKWTRCSPRRTWQASRWSPRPPWPWRRPATSLACSTACLIWTT